MQTDEPTTEVAAGEAVYNESGDQIGTVRGFDEHGFYVSAGEGVETLADQPTGSVSTDALMWRCWECGEMGQLAGMPAECPACGAPREELYYWQED